MHAHAAASVLNTDLPKALAQKASPLAVFMGRAAQQGGVMWPECIDLETTRIRTRSLRMTYTRDAAPVREL